MFWRLPDVTQAHHSWSLVPRLVFPRQVFAKGLFGKVLPSWEPYSIKADQPSGIQKLDGMLKLCIELRKEGPFKRTLIHCVQLVFTHRLRTHHTRCFFLRVLVNRNSQRMVWCERKICPQNRALALARICEGQQRSYQFGTNTVCTEYGPSDWNPNRTSGNHWPC